MNYMNYKKNLPTVGNCYSCKKGTDQILGSRFICLDCQFRAYIERTGSTD